MTDKEQQLLEAKAGIIKALGHPTRLRIAEQLRTGEQCVCEFVEEFGTDFSTVSKHLSVLKQAGIVASEKRGKQVYYHLKVPCILDFISCIEAVITNRSEELRTLIQQ